MVCHGGNVSCSVNPDLANLAHISKELFVSSVVASSVLGIG